MEHIHYAQELRLLGARSVSLMERLSRSSTLPEGRFAAVGNRIGGGASPGTVSLRSVVERCSGLLSRVAGGRTIEVSFGEAASAPVQVDREAVERILANLVCNAAAAMSRRGVVADAAADAGALEPAVAAADGFVEMVGDGTDDETPGAIRIGVGVLRNRVGDPRPWPFRRVRLTVEDSGCGMDPYELERLLSGGRAASRGSRGVGFRVVQELVAASGGELAVMSALGVGTRVQIEWPLAGLLAMDEAEGRESVRTASPLRQPGAEVRGRGRGRRAGGLTAAPAEDLSVVAEGGLGC